MHENHYFFLALNFAILEKGINFALAFGKKHGK